MAAPPPPSASRAVAPPPASPGGVPAWAGVAGIAVLGGVLAAIGAVRGVDSIVWYVLGIVDGIPLEPGALLKPVHNPPPMYTHAYRPLSTALVKALVAVFGRSPAGLQAATLAHGLVLIPYGLAGWAMAEAHGAPRRLALGGAALAMGLPTLLFSAWTLPEFDVLGGAFVLGAAAALQTRRWGLAVPLMAGALLTKETAAVGMLAYLLAWSSVAWGRGQARPALATAGFVAALAAAVAPIVLTPPPLTHAWSVADERFTLDRPLWLALHDLTQLQLSMGAAGCALVALFGARGWRRLPRWILPGVLAVLLFAAPILRVYNHYESLVPSHPVWVAVWGLVLVGGLLSLGATGDDADRTQGRFALLMLAGLLAGPVLTGFSRADLSARLFAPVLAPLLVLALRGAQGARRRSRPEQVAAAGLAVLLGTDVLLGTFNAATAHRARFRVEGPAKAELAAALTGGCPTILATHRDHELAVEELAALGATVDFSAGCAQLVQLDRLDTTAAALADGPDPLAGFDHRRDRFEAGAATAALTQGAPVEEPLHVYIQGARALFDLSEELRPHLQMAWALGRLPEVQPGWLEQAVGAIYADETALERAAAARASDHRSAEAPFLQLPRSLSEVPRRLVHGVPLVEPYVYRAERFTVAPTP